jgi:hypothetical protein
LQEQRLASEKRHRQTFARVARRLFQKRRASARKLAPKVEHAELQTGSSRKYQSVERALIAGVAKSEFVCARDGMHVCIFGAFQRHTLYSSIVHLGAIVCSAEWCVLHQFLIKALSSNILSQLLLFAT